MTEATEDPTSRTLPEPRLHQIRMAIAFSSTNGPDTSTGMLVDLMGELDRIRALCLPDAPPVGERGFPRPFQLIVGGQRLPGAEWPDGRIALEVGEPYGLMALAGTVHELLAMQPEGSRIEWAEASTGVGTSAATANEGGPSVDSCRVVVADGGLVRIHGQGELTAAAAAALGALVQVATKQLAASTGQECRWPDCLPESRRRLLDAQVDAGMRGVPTVPMADQRVVCGCVDRGASIESLPTSATGGEPR